MIKIFVALSAFIGAAWNSLSGGDFLPHAQTAGAITLVNLTGFQRGIASDETGINVRQFRTVVEPEWKEFLGDKQNAARGFAVAPMKKTVNIEGEVSGSTGVMAAVATTAFAPVNSSAYFGAPTTGLYLDRGEVTEGRDAWKDVTAEFTANAGIP